MDLPVDQLLTNVEPAQRDELLKRDYLKPPVETSLNAFLINTGSKLVLIDTGAGSLFGPTLGRLPSSLAAAGYRPEQVDAVLITHMHGDHVGGLASDGKPAFPNAVVYSSKLEADYWLSQANMDKAPADAQRQFRGRHENAEALHRGGKVPAHRQRHRDRARDQIRRRLWPHARATTPTWSRAAGTSSCCGAISCTSQQCNFQSPP